MRILITGGTGFLGRKLARMLTGDHEVTLAARNHKQNLQAERDIGCEVLPLNVASIESVRDVVSATRPQVIIHAAATKFVDRAEREPLECVDINVVGSQNVARVAIDKNVDLVIGISTDKASPPIRNTYGLSKAMMERVFVGLDGKSNTRFSCVRYGNVAWSTGSVFTIWKRMHEQSGHIETTGRSMRRFIFTVDEAAQLVRTALSHSEALAGCILSRKMKAAQMGDILEVWTGHLGGSWTEVAGRPGERQDEFLIGELELPFTQSAYFDDVEHYVITFNEKVNEPLLAPISSATAERLTDEEILRIISSPPADEKM